MPERCELCGGYWTFLGVLGHAQWFRCRDCGVQLCVTIELVARHDPEVDRMINEGCPNVED